MKNHFVPIILMIIYVFPGCKKEKDKEPVVKKAIVTTIAGQYDGFADGPLASAQFDRPADLAITTDGSIYVADRYNRRIRRIYGNLVSTYAGNGGSDYVDSTGPKAEFPTPHCITADQNGNLYVLDANDPRVRKINTAALVSTYAGMATEGYVDGPVSNAKFRYSNGITTDKNGNVFVADAANHCIRKISAAGQVSTLAGNGLAGYTDDLGTKAQFNAPYGIAVDKNGNVFVLDVLNYRIRKITPAGQVSTIAGTGTSGTADGNKATAQFGFMQGVAIDGQGNLYVSDEDRIRKVSPNGTVTTIAGGDSGFEDGEGIGAKFAAPKGLAIDAEGNIYIADEANHRIRKITFE